MNTAILLLGALAGYALMMWTNPVRASFRDGLRVVRRYPQLWIWLGVFGFGYALFRLALKAYFASVLPEGEGPGFRWAHDALWDLPPGALLDLAGESFLPAVESTAGLFNNLVSTFPLAAIGAFLLLINWNGHQRVLLRALRKRFGVWAWLIHLSVLACAAAAMTKPLAYLFARLLPADIWLVWSPVLAWLAFLFEYLLGVGLQVYLLLLAWCWVRGLSVRQHHLQDFAIRRFAHLLRWSLVGMALSTLAIDLPLMLQNVEPFAGWFPAQADRIDARVKTMRAMLSAFFLLFATLQITLILHSESLTRALRDHFAFLRRNSWPFTWFLIIAAIHFFAIHWLDAVCRRAVGEGSALWVVWHLLFPWIAGWTGAWLLASWAAEFHRRDPRRSKSALPGTSGD